MTGELYEVGHGWRDDDRGYKGRDHLLCSASMSHRSNTDDFIRQHLQSDVTGVHIYDRCHAP